MPSRRAAVAAESALSGRYRMVYGLLKAGDRPIRAAIPQDAVFVVPGRVGPIDSPFDAGPRFVFAVRIDAVREARFRGRPDGAGSRFEKVGKEPFDENIRTFRRFIIGVRRERDSHSLGECDAGPRDLTVAVSDLQAIFRFTRTTSTEFLEREEGEKLLEFLRRDHHGFQLPGPAIRRNESRPDKLRGKTMLYEPSTLTSAPIRKLLMKAAPAAGGASRLAHILIHSCRSQATPPG